MLDVWPSSENVSETFLTLTSTLLETATDKMI